MTENSSDSSGLCCFCCTTCRRWSSDSPCWIHSVNAGSSFSNSLGLTSSRSNEGHAVFPTADEGMSMSFLWSFGVWALSCSCVAMSALTCCCVKMCASLSCWQEDTCFLSEIISTSWAGPWILGMLAQACASTETLASPLSSYTFVVPCCFSLELMASSLTSEIRLPPSCAWVEYSASISLSVAIWASSSSIRFRASPSCLAKMQGISVSTHGMLTLRFCTGIMSSSASSECKLDSSCPLPGLLSSSSSGAYRASSSRKSSSFSSWSCRKAANFPYPGIFPCFCDGPGEFWTSSAVFSSLAFDSLDMSVFGVKMGKFSSSQDRDSGLRPLCLGFLCWSSSSELLSGLPEQWSWCVAMVMKLYVSVWHLCVHSDSWVRSSTLSEYLKNKLSCQLLVFIFPKCKSMKSTDCPKHPQDANYFRIQE